MFTSSCAPEQVTQWPAFKKWDRDYLQTVFGTSALTAGPISIPYAEYMRYSDQTREESPLYVFDKRFIEKAPILLDDYSLPEYFAEDLF